ncbi:MULTISPECIES: hypothetical protein [unclassified Microcoleus]|uniref:hypothetical protein n=1 Tax=unclassified Microcoleus TaxID=2642155 RepID=UPI002FD219B6
MNDLRPALTKIIASLILANKSRVSGAMPCRSGAMGAHPTDRTAAVLSVIQYKKLPPSCAKPRRSEILHLPTEIELNYSGSQAW